MENILYPLVLILHLLSAIVFSAMAFINAYVINRIDPELNSDLFGMGSVEMKMHIKKVMHLAIGILIVTGIYLLTLHLDSLWLADIHSLALSLKLVLAFIVVLLFFMAPFIVRQLREKSKRDIQILNQFLFGSVVTIIVLAKLVLFV